ncbi:O-antigen ligase family protein [uncultured Winogradskyella sp.]|uniref:O-antigen ligase family protein n=1 Tax=uncultured Winogradskyella sp. TaxID=395353 RepID=UPI003515FE5C
MMLKRKLVLRQIKEITLIIGILFLPINQNINHWFFALFMILSFVEFFIRRENFHNLRAVGKLFFLSCAIFFFLRVIFFFHSSNMDISQKELIRALPFLLYPLCILTLWTKKGNYKLFERRIFWSLTAGCLISAAICWSNVLINMEANPIPAQRFFGWKKSGTYLTSILDLHPPYLGMMLFASIVFLFNQATSNEKSDRLQKILYGTTILVLLIFLFNITARNSLLFLSFLGFVYFIYKRYWKLVFLSLIAVISAVILIINHPSQYYRLKLYHMLGLSQEDAQTDKRFKRLNASYKVFQQNPIYGVGLGIDTELKVKEYNATGDKVAAVERYNSHNQFFEYLAAYGIIGGMVFIVAFLILIFILLKLRFEFLLILVLNIILASFTESIFERALGIQYYSVIFSLVLLKIIYSRTRFNSEWCN